MQDAVIVSATRTAVGKAPNGSLRTVRPDDMAASVIGEALRRVPSLRPADVDDVLMGCAMPEAEQGLNVARIASLRADIPVSASAVTINRFCSSGLQAIAFAAERIMCGAASVIVAGGTESMSLVPMGGHKLAPNPVLVDRYPDVYLSTGLVAENHARESRISREEQDAFALRSHQRALAAIDSGRFAASVRALADRDPGAEIWGFPKRRIGTRVYVTDASGIVVFDSTGADLGQDYSRWNDVYLTLRGRYGANVESRTVREEHVHFPLPRELRVLAS